MSSESKILSSSFSSQGALPSWSDLKELLQTISARAAVLWAGVGFTGLISCNRTLKPAWAICQAASEPARPPPATIMGSCFIPWNSNTVYQGRAAEGLTWTHVGYLLLRMPLRKILRKFWITSSCEALG